MRSRQASARTRLGEESDLATVLRGAGLHRVLASAVGFASVVLPASWTGLSQYSLYTFAGRSMTAPDSFRIVQHGSMGASLLAGQGDHELTCMKVSHVLPVVGSRHGVAGCRYLIRSTNWFVVNLDKLTYAANLASLESIAGNPR